MASWSTNQEFYILKEEEIAKCMTNLKVKGHHINQFQQKSNFYRLFKNSENNLIRLRKRIQEMRCNSTSPASMIGFNERLYHMNLMDQNPCKEPACFKRITRNFNKYSHKLTNSNKIELPRFAEIPSYPRLQECTSCNDRNPFEHSFIKYLKSPKNSTEQAKQNKVEHRVKFSNLDLEIHLLKKDKVKHILENANCLDSDRVSVERIPHKNDSDQINLHEQNNFNQTLYSDL